MARDLGDREGALGWPRSDARRAGGAPGRRPSPQAREKSLDVSGRRPVRSHSAPPSHPATRAGVRRISASHLRPERPQGPDRDRRRWARREQALTRARPRRAAARNLFPAVFHGTWRRRSPSRDREQPADAPGASACPRIVPAETNAAAAELPDGPPGLPDGPRLHDCAVDHSASCPEWRAAFSRRRLAPRRISDPYAVHGRRGKRRSRSAEPCGETALDLGV